MKNIIKHEKSNDAIKEYYAGVRATLKNRWWLYLLILFVSVAIGAASEAVPKINPLEGLPRSADVLSKSIDKFHNFSSIVDNYGAYGKQLLLKGGDETYRLWVIIEGAYDGKEGALQDLIDNGVIIHRMFGE